MHSAARIPARVNRRERDQAVRVADLIAAQELLSGCVDAAVADIGVDAVSVAVPDVKLRAFEYRTRAVREDSREGKSQLQRRTIRAGACCWIDADVRALQSLLDGVEPKEYKE